MTNTITSTSLASLTKRHQISYLVPNMQTRLEMFIGARMNSELLEIFFELIQSYCDYTIRVLGDRPLPPSMDSLSRNGAQGERVTIKYAEGQRLTFSILEDTMRGLSDVLIFEKINSDAEFEVYHANLSMVGVGNVTDRSENPRAVY